MAIELRASGDIAVQGTIEAKGSKTRNGGGDVDVTSNGGSVETSAVIDALPGYDADYGSPGLGGSIVLRGAAVTINGRAVTGSGDGARAIMLDTCRLRMGRKGKIDAAKSRQYSSPAIRRRTCRRA